MSELRPFQVGPDARVQTKREMRMLRKAPPIDPDSAEYVLNCLSQGIPITTVGAMPGLPPYALINAWRRQYPEFDAACVQASEAGAEKMLWQTIEIADDTTRHPACREVSIRARQHAMKVLHRKRFDPGARVMELQAERMADELSDDELARMVVEGQASRVAPETPQTATTAGAKGETPVAGPHFPEEK